MKSLYYNNKKEMPFSPCKECDINSLCSNLQKGAGNNDEEIRRLTNIQKRICGFYSNYKFKPTEKLKRRRF